MFTLFVRSGHGGTARDQNGDEEGGDDDTICPADFQQAGEIIDDDLNLMLAKKVPPGEKKNEREARRRRSQKTKKKQRQGTKMQEGMKARSSRKSKVLRSDFFLRRSSDLLNGLLPLWYWNGSAL